jgi:hypothetical protein
LGSDLARFGAKAEQIGHRLGSDWVQIGFRLVQIGFRLGSDWVQIRLGSGLRPCRLGSDWDQIGFRLGSDWVVCSGRHSTPHHTDPGWQLVLSMWGGAGSRSCWAVLKNMGKPIAQNKFRITLSEGFLVCER